MRNGGKTHLLLARQFNIHMISSNKAEIMQNIAQQLNTHCFHWTLIDTLVTRTGGVKRRGHYGRTYYFLLCGDLGLNTMAKITYSGSVPRRQKAGVTAVL